MTLNNKLFYLFTLIGLLLSGCEALKKAEQTFQKTLEPILPKNFKIEKKIMEKKSISISCDNDDIQNYLDKGWEVKSSETEEAICTWKSIQAKRGCDLNLDKGCRITVPDKIGKKVEYLLERQKEIP